MRDYSLIRRTEPWFVVGTVTIYVIRRLVEEVTWFDDKVGSATGNGVSPATFWRHLARYDHTLNNNIPLIGGAVLVLVAWYVFHSLAYPRLQAQIDDRKAWFYMGLTALLLLAGVFLYHYLKLYVRYQHNQAGSVIGLAVYSLYRKRTVLADAIGIGIFLGTYELIFQYYLFIYQRITKESAAHFRLVSYLLLGGLIILALTFALNIYIRPTLWQSGTRDLLGILAILLLIAWLQAYIYTYILPLLKEPRITDTRLLMGILVYLLIIAAGSTMIGAVHARFDLPFAIPARLAFGVLVASASIAYLRQTLNREKTVLQTQVSAGAAELASLRAQINPHFLFNALNSLYATALKEKGEKTADGIQKLGDMMRFMLQENNHDRIPLDKEIEYLRNYIEIQRMRIDESPAIEIRVTIQEPTRAIYLAPMLLTPFVENAFKYGISLQQPSWIYITLTLDDTRLYFKVHNTRHPKPQYDPEAGQSGVGLANVRKRLDLIYPGRHQLDIQQSEQDYFVSLTLVYW